MKNYEANDPWQVTIHGDGPLVATAIHHGHAVRPEVAYLLALTPEERLREEDPFTGRWTRVAPTRVVVHRSRFEVDLNRPRDKAVYQKPADSWGLSVWNRPLPRRTVDRSLVIYDQFYRSMAEILSERVRRYGRVLVLDLHSYNHRRAGPAEPPEDPAANPDINIGTGTMDRAHWAGVVDRAIAELQAREVLGRRLDVRENVRFFGGHFPRWVHTTFPETGCALAIEVKKFFMDEWTGQADNRQIDAIKEVLASIIPSLYEELDRRDFSRHKRRTDLRRAGRSRRRPTRSQ